MAKSCAVDLYGSMRYVRGCQVGKQTVAGLPLVAGKTRIPEAQQKEMKLCASAEYVRLVAGTSPSAR